MQHLISETTAGDEFGRHAPADAERNSALQSGIPITYRNEVSKMNDRSNITGNAQVTMSSREIAAVKALEKIADAHGSFTRTEAAKHIGVSPQTLIRWFRINRWTYRRPGSRDELAYQSKITSGYLEHKIVVGPRSDGTEWVSTQVRVTPKGLTVLARQVR